MEFLTNLFTLFFQNVNQLFWLNPVAQTIGLIALFVGVYAFLHRDDQKLRVYLSVFTLFMCIHFLMLGLWTAATMAFLSAIRNYLSSRTSNIWVMTVFLLVALTLAIPNVTDPIHLLPILATTLGTWALFREHGIRMRFLMLIGTVSWLSHNFLAGSLGGVLIESLFVIINTHTMIKLFKSNRSQTS
ncbi:YgjV family protein [Paraglaciecola aquimarina]|uniref:YgjV family protein n=1 Tax=Paraglaciecola algarum TaxID=3050085 RepID=A0ABS9D657_9ALTE|nr:YgjV family protein [Paraglaciecola sp. G1-23]MCF2948389.1 YgjV family protein [Paraglaciecola sp. G1-23]